MGGVLCLLVGICLAIIAGDREFHNIDKNRNMIDRKKLLLLLLVLLGMPAAAEIYRWQDAAGEIHYSDRPHGDARAVAVHPGHAYYRVKRFMTETRFAWKMA